MPIGGLKEIINCRPRDKRLLGMDLGDKTIGLAVSDHAQSIATPLVTLPRKKFAQDVKELERIVKDYDIGGYIMGWPVNMDGTTGPRCDVTRSYADEMTKYPQILGTDPWIALWDERLSTASVEDFLVESVDMSRTKRKQVIDKLAAQHILQGALDFMNG